MEPMPAGICRTIIGRDEFFQSIQGAPVRDDGPLRHRIIEIDATDQQVTAIKNYMRARGIHGIIRKPEETDDAD